MRFRKLITGGVLLGSSLTACAEIESTPQAISPTIYDGIIEVENENWSVRCVGPEKPVVAKVGNTLL